MTIPIKLKKITPFLLSFFWVIIALWIEFTPKTSGTTSELVHNFFKRADYLIYDIRQLSTLNAFPRLSYPIVIVAIDNISLQQEGRWPWSYYKIANLLRRIREQGATVIASDILFNEAEKNMVSVIKNKLLQTHGEHTALFDDLDKLEPEFDDNALLIQQVLNKNDIVLPFYLEATPYTQGRLPQPLVTLDKQALTHLSIQSMPGYITNFNALQAVSLHNGFISTLTDEDGVLRRTPLVIRYQERVYPSLSLAVAKLLLPDAQVKLNWVDVYGEKYLKSIQLGDRHIPTDKAGRVLIPFHGKTHSFHYYSATDLLKNRLKAHELEHAIVFIGTTAVDLAHLSNTSVDSAMPDVEVHANVLHGILDNKFPYLPYWAKGATVGLIVIIGMALTILLPLLSPALSILLALSVMLLLIVVNIWLWVAMSIVFSFSVPLLMTIMLVLTNMTYGFLFESRKKKFLREMFGQYLAPDYVKMLIDHPDDYSLEGESVELTVLFADIRGFTTISENLDASGVKKLLNQYFTPMTQIIFNHGGTIDKYVGDMIMAFWGAPIKNPDHCEAAIDAALDMLAKSEQLKIEFHAAGLPQVNIGIGINTGLMNVGDMGSEFRRSYTVLGDPVNLASRLESSTKYYGVKLLVGSTTRALQTKFLFRSVDRVKVKGKHVAVDVYEVVCRMDQASPELLQEIAMHEKAISAYFKADWVEARPLFTSLAKQYPDTIIYQLFLDRLSYFEQNPPAKDWDGSYERLEK